MKRLIPTTDSIRQENDGSISIGTPANYVQINPNGQISLVGGAIVQDDFQVQLANVKAPASDPPTWSIYKGCELPLFGAGGTNVVYFTAQFQHSWEEGTNVEPHIHLAYTNANAGNSVWRFTYSWANMGANFPTETTVDATFSSPEVTDRHTYNTFGNVSGSGNTKSSIMLCSLSRLGGDAADTYASGIYAVSADIHISKNKLGSY